MMDVLSFERGDQTFVVRYEITDESFDHEFGLEKKYGIKVHSIKVWCSAVKNEWIDLTDIVSDQFLDSIETKIRNSDIRL